MVGPRAQWSAQRANRGSVAESNDRFLLQRSQKAPKKRPFEGNVNLESGSFEFEPPRRLLLSTHSNESNRIEMRARRGWVSAAVAEDVGPVLRVSSPAAASSSLCPEG